MASKAPKRLRGASSNYRRATKAELRILGKSPGSKTYVSAKTKTITARTASYSERQYVNTRNFEQLHQVISREHKRRLIIEGRIGYKPGLWDIIEKRRNRGEVRRRITGVTSSDADKLYLWRKYGAHGAFGKNYHKQVGELASRYSRDELAAYLDQPSFKLYKAAA